MYNKKQVNIFYLINIHVLIIMLSIIFCGCTKKNNEDNNDLIVILHAGGGINGYSYMNSQETFLYYYNMGYKYFEYDLKLSSDGRLIGTHAGENIDSSESLNFDSITYEEFKQIKLNNGYTPVNEEWLMDIIINYPDIKIVVDAKANTIEEDAIIIQRFEQLEKIYNYDLSSNIIPEVFSLEMWNILKETTTFDKYLFSHYKVYYNVNMIIDYFYDERIWGISIPIWSDSDFRSQIYRLKEMNKKIFVFTAYNNEDVLDIINMGGDGLYVDDPLILKNKK